jgi:hypothetical protein
MFVKRFACCLNCTDNREWIMLDFTLFVVPAYHYKYYTSREHIYEFRAMYFFLQAVRSQLSHLPHRRRGLPYANSSHCIRFCGKSGALLVAVLYDYIGT